MLLIRNIYIEYIDRVLAQNIVRKSIENVCFYCLSEKREIGDRDRESKSDGFFIIDAKEYN